MEDAKGVSQELIWVLSSVTVWGRGMGRLEKKLGRASSSLEMNSV